MRSTQAPSPIRIRRGISAVAVAVVVAATLAAAAVAGTIEEQLDGGVVRVGQLDRIPADAVKVFGEKIIPEGFFEPIGTTEHAAAPYGGSTGTLLLLPEARQLWQFFLFHDGIPRTGILVRDPDTLAIKKSFVLDFHLRRAGARASGGAWMHTIDSDRRVFLMNDGNKAIVEIDLRTYSVRSFPAAPEAIVFPVGGMTYDPYGDRVLVAHSILGSATVLNATTLLYEFNASSGAVKGPRTLRSCNAPLPSTENNQTYQVAPYIANRDFAYVPCQRSGYSGTVLRIPRGALMDPSSPEEVAVGPVNLETVLVDKASGRMFLATARGELWAFDAATMAFVGVVGANADSGTTADVAYGLDAMTGRVFFQSPTFGLGMAEGRFFPIPQAKTVRSLAAPGQEEIVSDSVTNKVFVLEGVSNDKAFAYTIYRVPPAPTPPPPPDPDANTADLAEKKGVTEARYNSTASGYGVRVLLANGVATIPPAPGVGDLAPTAEVLAKNLRTPCGFTDRELIAARVTKTEADTGSTAAAAIAVELDPRTQVDLDQPSRCDVKGKDNSGTEVFRGIFNTAPAAAPLIDNPDSDKPRWDHEPAVCSSSEGDEAPSRGEGKHDDGLDLGPAEVHCPLPGGKLSGRAETKLEGVISVGKTVTETQITRDGKGVHAVAKATASDIEIGEGIHIAEIRSVAQSDANGRPRGKASLSNHTVSIKGLSILGETVCGVCNPTEAVDALNRVLAGRAQFRIGFGAADQRLVEGSPRGALTAVQKSPERQVSDQSLVGDFTTEIPALELIVYNDNNKWGRARQLYQFAGVSTSATYNIIGVPRDSDFSPTDGDGTLDGTLDTVGNVLGDMPSAMSPDEIALREDAGGNGVFDKIRRALRAAARGVRLFLTSPRHAILLLTGWALLLMPVGLYRRRLTLAGLD